MTTPSTPLDLDAISARAAAATEGPWVIERARIWSGEPHPPKTELLMFRGGREWTPDAEFIAHARTDVPALVEEVKRLREQVGCMQDGINAAVQAKESVVADRNYAMRQRDEERAAKEGNIAALNAACIERDEALVKVAAGLALTDEARGRMVLDQATGERSWSVSVIDPDDLRDALTEVQAGAGEVVGRE